jgi:teichuronic acid biosynthesis glycosyltransferase TuaG
MNRDNIQFSIIIPYFNSINTIERALTSILYQTFNNYEVILINDGSKDITIEFINSFIDKFNFLGINLIYINLINNAGPSVARNIGWENAKGEYICFLDADDMWHPNKLNTCDIFINKINPDFIFHDSGISQTGKLSEILNLEYSINNFIFLKCNKFKWFLKNLAVTPSVLIKREVKLRFNEKMKYCEDYDLWLRIAFSNKCVYQIKGSALTFLGKAPMTGNGLSSRIFKMRLGEISLFYNFCKQKKIFLPFLPLFIIFSLIKHFRLLFKKSLNLRFD